MASDLQRLPPGFHTGVTEDGRIFFINDLDRTTSWLHPVTHEPILTGLHSSPDLPRGWEADTTADGRVYFIDHTRGLTTFAHPIQGHLISSQGSVSSHQSPQSPSEPSSPYGRDNFKRGTSKQRSVKAPSAKRNPNSEVIKSGWLYRLESSGLSKSWKKRWVVLADFALFTYKDTEEATVLSSILLPSYRINPCTEEDNIKRNFVFKVEHENTKTVYLATDDSPELVSWMSLLRQSAMMNGNVGFQREPNNNYRQHPFKEADKEDMRVPEQRFESSHNPSDIMNSNQNLNRSSQNPNNLRPYTQQDDDPRHAPSNRFSNASQSPSYKGYHDPSSSPLGSPSEPRPRMGGVYPFIHQQGQRRSYVSQGSSNRNSLANSPQAPINSSQAYPVGNRPDSSHFYPKYDDQQSPKRVQPVQEGYAYNQYPGYREQFSTQLKDGFEPDSVRSSLAQSDMSRNYPNPSNGYPTERGHQQHELRNGNSQSHVPSDWMRDQQDSYSDIQDGGQVKQLQQWDRNLPAMGAESMKHSSFDNLLDGVSRSQGETFNTRSKSHENFSQFPNMRHQNGGESQAHIPNSKNGYGPDSNGANTRTSAPPWNRPYSFTGHPESGRGSFADPSYRGPEPPSHESPQDQRGNFRSPSERSHQLRRGDAYGSMNPPFRDSYDRNSQSSIQNEITSREAPRRDEDLRSYAPRVSAGVHPHRSFDGEHPRSSPAPMLQNSFNSFDRESNQGQFHPDQRWRDNSFSSYPGRSDPHQTNSSMQHHPDQDHSFRPHMQLDASYQSDSSYPNPHTYVNLPTRKPSEDPATQYTLDPQQRHNMSHDFAQNLSHDSSSDPPPVRPPYPAAVRDQIVQEIAQAQTPSTQKDFLISSELNKQRMQQPSYFQYPSPRGQHSRDTSQDLDRSRNSRTSQRSMDVNFPNDAPSSRFLTASRNSQSSRKDQNDGRNSQAETPARRNMMDPEAQSMRIAFERVHSLRMSPERAPPRRQVVPIHTVKEDPNMPDKDVLETDLQKVAKKNPLQGPRLRMSICASDLIGKTHDELVLLLIQLRRNQAALDKTRDFYKQQIDQRRSGELEYRRQMHQFGNVQDRRLHDVHQSYADAKGQMEEIEKKLEVYRPIINLLDNMVTMGSLYGGDNLMLATQYRKHLLRPDQYQPAKKMLEFSRQHQENRLIQETNEEIKQLSADEVDLEEKIDRLNEIDRLLQEQSFKVSSFKEDKELMERALHGIFRQQDQIRHDPHEMRRLMQQQRTLEKEISRVTQQLAEASKELEETTAENNKLEHEVALLRTKVHGELTRSRSAPSLASESMRTKMKMEKELAKVQDIMQGLNQQGAKLSQAMNTLRRSSSGTQLVSFGDNEENEPMPSGTYLQTDIDTGDQVDLAKAGQVDPSPLSQQFISHQRQNANEPEMWNADEGDENTRRFFGLGPKDKVKGQTVRDVKRLSEARREREKRKEEDDYGEEIKLRVSNVDTEDSSFIQARIAGELKSRPGGQPWESGHPLYENLPRYGSMPALPDSQSAASSRRSSIILMAPKPFTPYQDKTAKPFKSEFALDPTNGANGFSQSEAKQDNEHTVNGLYLGQDALKLNSQAYYSSSEQPGNHLTEAMYNGNYMAQQNGSQLSSPYSEGQFHAKPLTIQPTNQANGPESPLTQDRTDSLQAGRRLEVGTYEGIQSEAYVRRPLTKVRADVSEEMLNVKKTPRGRYQTISSSQPFKLETNALLSPTLHSSAGDLILNRSIDDVPDIVKSSQTKVDQIDEDMIDREILYVPDKVLIPERYDAEADAEQLTEEDRVRRIEKAERIKKVLTSQSVLSISQPDISHLPANEIHSRVELEKKERAHFLALNQELARQVTLQSRKQAAERRKTWSGGQFADAKKQYEEELLKSSPSPLRSPDMNRKRSEITMRDI